MQLSQKFFHKVSMAIVALSSLAMMPMFLSAGTASAQPDRFTDSYVGAGVSAGVTNGGQGKNSEAVTGGNIQGRIAIPKVPVSVRGAVLFGGDNAAIMPMLTYDQRISNNANVYVGAGYSFSDKDGKPTPLGNRDAVVITAGAEAGIGKSFVVYGDAKWGINAYENSDADAVSLQAGFGYRF
jgi:hypothetical protein